MRSIAALWRDEPTAYRLNGNRIFVSTTKRAETPLELLRDYQDAFTEYGVNERPLYQVEPSTALQRKRMGMTGGVVPLQRTPTHVIMGGVEMRGDAETPTEIFAQMPRAAGGPAELFRAYRWVEIRREPDSPVSTVMASWSDVDFDYAKMFPARRGAASRDVDHRVPMCPGCQKVNQFADDSRAGTHETFVFVTDQRLAEVRDFYEDRLRAQGWQPREHVALFDELRRQIGLGSDQMQRLEYARDELTLELAIYPLDEGGSGVRAVLVDETFLGGVGLSADRPNLDEHTETPKGLFDRFTDD